MIDGTPVELPCPQAFYRTRCFCGRCAVCNHPKHSSIHGGVIDQPRKVWGHEFVPMKAAVDNRARQQEKK